MRSVLTILAGFIALLGVVGCSSMTPGKMSSIQPVTTNERVGSVFLLRGWIAREGDMSDKLDALSQYWMSSAYSQTAVMLARN